MNTHKSININKKAIGQQIEELAAVYLVKQNLKILNKNFRCKFGEIDLICQDAKEEQIIFVEVRYKRFVTFGTPLDSVNVTKQKKIIKTAHYYLNKYFYELPINYRFDIVSCIGPIDLIKIDWCLGAFHYY